MDTTPNDAEFEYEMKHSKELDMQLLGTKVVTYDSATKTKWIGTYRLNEDGELYIQRDDEPEEVVSNKPGDVIDIITKWSKSAFR